MAYTVVKSFDRGLDTRKLLDTTEPGTLLEAKNCHITLGGELEKRAAFIVKTTLPGETIGLYVGEGRVIHTWGDDATAPAGMPAGAIYHAVPSPDGTPLVRVLSVVEFNDGMFVTALYESNHAFHWFNDELVTVPPPDVIDDGSGGTVTPPDSSPTNKPQATGSFFPQIYTITSPPAFMHIYAIYLLKPSTTYNFTAGPGQDAWMLIPQTGTSGGKPVGDIQLDYETGSVGSAAITAAIMGAINTSVSTPKVQAQASATAPAQCLFWIDDASTTYNGWKLEFKFASISQFAPPPFSGGVDPPPPAPSPPPAPPAGPNPPTEKGFFALAHNGRIFSTQESVLRFCEPEDAANWDKTGDGAGYISHSFLVSRRPILVSMGDYGGDLAVFSKRHVFVWSMDTDPTGDRLRQTIHGTGTFAPYSVVPWGQTDIMYMDTSGIRSLRARDSSEQAFAADIGNLIDSLVKEKVAALTDDQKKYQIRGIVEPRSGRLWMACHDKIFVLTFYPSSRVSAWSWYDATEAPVDYLVSSDDSVYWRSGNDVMIYGDESGNVYDDTEALARIPYIDAGKTATHKNWTGIDVALFGDWRVRGSFDPTVPAALDLIANLTKSTYQQQKIAVNGESPALSLELQSTFIGPARIGNATLHYTESTAD